MDKYSLPPLPRRASSKVDLVQTLHARVAEQRSGSTATTATTDSEDSSSAAMASFSKQPMRRQRQSLPNLHESVTATDQRKPSLRRRQSSAQDVTKSRTAKNALTKNYLHLVKDFERLKPFARLPDGSYPRDVLCVFCEAHTPMSVFFPCQHKCVCEICLKSEEIGASSTGTRAWSHCPVCMTEIRVVLPHTGHEEERYWQWVLEVQPALPQLFKSEFKDAGRRLRKNSIAPDDQPIDQLSSEPREA
ncbi:hypothetical protein P43SY_003735 [Pythium insidiosum]|uniref:RING-type domain-containing protein n=1 Tax=Pythium insidiosum TaxID=114742 RepID=A0AAD5LE36_PYTIN|nr:hypothetical protein P43SY_003735 [Pythium insidiosum]